MRMCQRKNGAGNAVRGGVRVVLMDCADTVT